MYGENRDTLSLALAFCGGLLIYVSAPSRLFKRGQPSAKHWQSHSLADPS